MKNLHNVAKSDAEELKSGWIFGPPLHALVYCKCNIERSNQTEFNFLKTAEQ